MNPVIIIIIAAIAISIALVLVYKKGKKDGSPNYMKRKKYS